MGAAATYHPLSRLELVLGLVYGAGVEIAPVEELLGGYLDDFGYRLETIRLSDAFPAMLEESTPVDVPDATRQRQDQGDRLREHAGRSAAGRLAVFLIAGRRRRLDLGHLRRAWLVRSLRRPEEVQFLRQVYGPRFILLGIHAPEALRLHNLTNRRREKSPSTSGPFEVGAIEDIKRDEQDVTVPHGQSMRTTFAEADFVVDSRSDEALRATLGRTIDILFGDPFATPTSDEQAMAHAYASGVRSAEMGRQVGAALVNARGDIVATGTNEVPAGGGGLYWSGRQPDHRDFKEPVPVDSNTEWKRRVTRELLAIDPSDPSATPSRRMIMAQFIGVTPRGFSQYFDFSRIDRKDDVTGRAKRLGDRERLEPRVVRDYDTWSAGGPALPSDYLAEIEREAVQAFVIDMQNCSLTLPET